MYIARKLRQRNIVAYVLYMMQVEDTLRAYDLDIERLQREYLSRFDYDDGQLEEVTEWYAGLIEMMQMEMCQKTGHVQALSNVIADLEQRHIELLDDVQKPFYQAAYGAALPILDELRSKGMDDEMGDVANALDAVYGVTLLKMQGRQVSSETTAALAPVTRMLELLAENYES